MKSSLIVFWGLFLLLINSSHSATLIVSDFGQLLGATDVEVNGGFYNVSFQDDTCISLYGGCNDSNFVFTTEVAATSAAQALLDQVFIDGPLGEFDSNAGLISGCTHPDECFAITPYKRISTQSIAVALARNYWPGREDNIHLGTRYDHSSSYTTYAYDNDVFAVWEAAAVPVPTAAWLFSSALRGLAGMKRKRT